MNDLAEVQFQLPDTIDDLTKWDMFFSARIPLYKKLLKGVKSWEEASEEEKRILRRAQEEAENLIDIHTVMGEIYKGLPSEPGRPSGITDIDVGNLSPKQEYREQTGISEKKAQRFASLSDHADVVAEVKEEARANNELATETEILKRIDRAKKEERARLETELAEKDKRIEFLEQDSKEREDYIIELESREPEIKTVEVVKEVVPDDYEDLKKSKELSLRDYRSLESLRSKDQEKIRELQSRIKDLETRKDIDELQRKLEEEAGYFTIRTYDYIQKNGGFVWITERMDHLPEKQRKEFISTIYAIDAFAKQMVQNIGGYGIE